MRTTCSERDPCCGLFRLSVINPDANTLKLKNMAECPSDISEWGLLSFAGYQELSTLATTGLDMMIQPGEEIQISWQAGLEDDWIVLFLPMGCCTITRRPHSLLLFTLNTQRFSPFGPMALRCTSKTSLHTITSEMEHTA